ncbi:NAD-dependent epimerase/dehydratase family protein [bacterium]|nr:MAG: NAD-dependent epimerase/dehydratase family protein [bacterium]
MNILILGGTRFVGLHMAQAALDRDWRVSLYNRGQTNPEVLPQAWHLKGDRNEGYPRGQWDAVIDVSAYIPRHAGEAAAAIKAHRYLFVSTVSVYDISDKRGPDEKSPRVAPPDPLTEEITGETYGGLKTACEDVVLQHRSDAAILRPGLVVGPDDYTDRFDKWAKAFREGGGVPVPPRLSQPIQLIHGRDLAEFALDLLSSGREGAYNGVGPEGTLEDMFGALIATYPGSRAVPTTGTEGPFVMPENGKRDGLLRADDTKSVAAGLRARPIQTVVRDSASWL